MGRLPDFNEVKTFDNQRNATQISDGAATESDHRVDRLLRLYRDGRWPQLSVEPYALEGARTVRGEEAEK